jgi:hypothetical protein
MVWMGGGGFSLARALITLYDELAAHYPDQEWQTSAGTGTIGDAAHRAEGSASDHNPWLNNTVRALDVALTARGPSCEALFAMVNQMYGNRDPRVFPDGYAIFKGRITDWNNPGHFWPQQGDPHNTHVHISTSTNPAGYNATNVWPLPGVAPVIPPKPINVLEDTVAYMFKVNQAECIAAHVQWPGIFITDGVSLRHVVHTEDVLAFQAVGIKYDSSKPISLGQYHALGGV